MTITSPLAIGLTALMVSTMPVKAGADVAQQSQIASFASASYREAYALDAAAADAQIETISSKFYDGDSYQSYVQSLHVSGNLDAIKANGFSTTVATGFEQATEMADDVWEVQFPARMVYSGSDRIEQCLTVTMKVHYQEFDPRIINMISEPVECVADEVAMAIQKLAGN
jgi:hypothetical protein